MSEQCPSLSPETQVRCILPDTRKAHYAGHESAIVGSSRASWNTRPADERRWGLDEPDTTLVDTGNFFVRVPKADGEEL